MKADLAVLCCLPLDEAEWMERHGHPTCGDFVRRNAQELGDGDPESTWRIFQKEADFIQRRLTCFAQEKVQVVWRATSDDIVRAAARANDVVVIAHWKHERVFADDIPDPLQLLAVLQAHGQFREETPEHRNACALAARLDDWVLDGGTTLVPVPDNFGDGRMPASMLRREHLDTQLPLHPGSRLELWDAMVSAPDFSNLVDPSFAGTFWLPICYSAFLAERFRLNHVDAVCLCARERTNAGISLAKLTGALTLMRARHIPLWRALMEVSDIADDFGN